MQRDPAAGHTFRKNRDVAVVRREDQAVPLELREITRRCEGGGDAVRRDRGVVDPVSVVDARDAGILDAEGLVLVARRKRGRRVDVEMNAVGRAGEA